MSINYCAGSFIHSFFTNVSHSIHIPAMITLAKMKWMKFTFRVNDFLVSVRCYVPFSFLNFLLSFFLTGYLQIFQRISWRCIIWMQQLSRKTNAPEMVENMAYGCGCGCGCGNWLALIYDLQFKSNGQPPFF